MRSHQTALPAPGMSEKPLYTRTGRISKAKKGLKVHNCPKCGRSYTRAEHLRRHQKNHEEEPLRCKFPGCGKKFHREDLLQRHEERHNELSRATSRAPSITSHSGPDIDPSLTAAITSISTTGLSTAISEGIPTSLYAPATQQNMVSISSSRKTRASSSGHTYIRSVAPIPAEGYSAFQESWSPTQNYSSSSGYASPGYDYANMSCANPCYDPSSIRTRASSTASLVEPWHPYQHPLSPVSTASSLLFSWTDAEKSPGIHALGLPMSGVATSAYSITGSSISAPADPLAGLVMFPMPMKSYDTRDEDERKVLFPDEPFGLVSEMYQSGQYLDHYWQHFHPAFPIVHKPTFDLDLDAQAPLLRAAMLAIGAQYSDQPNSKADSRSLHERCLKLLAHRDLDVNLPLRLCDMQAIFLLEVLTQYRGRRAVPQLTARFKEMYLNLSHDSEIIPTSTLDELSTVAPTADAHSQYTQWKEWIRISSKQRILVACFILEAQQTTLLSRKIPSTVISGFDLPVPAPSTIWDAESAPRWVSVLQQHPSTIRYVYEISTQYISPDAFGCLDAFQSSLLIFTHFDASNSSNPYFNTPDHQSLAQILDSSTQTQLLLLAARLCQAAPIVDVLAVSGESWILNEKISSKETFEEHKKALSTWVSKLWHSDTKEPVRLAVEISTQILRLALDIRPDFRHTLGTELGLYYATLVLWAVTSAATSRWQRSSTPAPPAPTSSTPPTLSILKSSQKTTNELEQDGFDFLHLAATGVGSTGSRGLLDETVLKKWQDGICATMQLLVVRLGGETASRGSALGELLDGVVGVLKKLSKKPASELATMF